jgi:predicted Zn-dependent protease
MMNSKGLFAYNTSTNTNFSVTVRTADGTGSGYATRGYTDITKLDAKKATQIATEKAVKSVKARAIEPGKYTVILRTCRSSSFIREYLFQIRCTPSR